MCWKTNQEQNNNLSIRLLRIPDVRLVGQLLNHSWLAHVAPKLPFVIGIFRMAAGYADEFLVFPAEGIDGPADETALASMKGRYLDGCPLRQASLYLIIASSNPHP